MGFEATLLKKTHGLVLGLEKAKMALFLLENDKIPHKMDRERPPAGVIKKIFFP
jgi:hypothetical protein